MHGIRDGDYVYFGRYKAPLLYYWFCQSWVNRKLGEDCRFPELDGRLLLLDGHWFFWKKDSEAVKQWARKAIGEKDAKPFSALFGMVKEATDRMLEVSGRLAAGGDVTSAQMKEFFGAMHDMEYPWVVTMPLGEVFEEIVEVKLAGAGLPEDAMQSFFVVEKPTFFMRQKTEMLELKKELAAEGLLDSVTVLPAAEAAALVEEKNQRLHAKIQQHVEQFKWFGMMHFWGSPFTVEKFFEQLKTAREASQEKTQSADLNEELLWLKKQGAGLSYWRQHLAEVCAIASCRGLAKLEHASQKMGLRYGQAMWLTSQEFLDGMDGKPVPPLDVLGERKKAFGLLVENGEIVLVVGRELQALLCSMLGDAVAARVLKGTVACKGFARGVARIVFSPDDASKVREGDVLVAPETTPDLVPAAQRACAIVTDIGGITSHAAIIGRELGIPCIVGTGNATRAIRDGDLIEVDADKGVIRIVG